MIAMLAVSSLASLTGPANAAEFSQDKANLIGVSGNVFPWEPNFSRFQSLLDESRAGWARTEIRFEQVHPAPERWVWDSTDAVVNTYAERGMQQLGLLGYSAGWASGQGGSDPVFAPPTNMDAWEEYVSAVASRYKGTIRNWEIWNEPDVAFFWGGRDGGDPAVYLELLKRAHRAIKAVDPQAVVVSGGVTGTERGANYLNTLYDLGGAQYMDAIGLHGYVSNDGLDTTIYPDVIWPMLSKARERYGKPFWITEFGWENGCRGGASACSEDVQANRIARHLPMLFSLGGVAHVSIFQFKDPGDTPDYYGLVRADGTPKRAFTAVATMATQLAGTAFEGRINRGDGRVWDMRFVGPDKTVDIVFSNAGDRDLWLETNAGGVRVYDMDGNRQDIGNQGGGVSLRIGINPLVVVRDGQEPPAERCRFFPETNNSLCGRFLDYWNRYGGLSIFGYPLSGLIWEDGKMAQYLERMKFEYQPEAEGTDWAVVGELVGRTMTSGRESEQAFRSIANPVSSGSASLGSNCQFFAETGHQLCNTFKGYWEANGGLWMFGYPISEEFSEVNWDTGQTYTVQYFERARFEYHPENEGTPYVVLLGRLSAQIYDERY